MSVLSTSKSKKKSKAVPLHAMEARGGERRYSSYSFLTSALDGGVWSASRPGRALPPGKEPPVPIVQEAGWAPEPVWTQGLEETSSAPVGDRTSIARSPSPYLSTSSSCNDHCQKTQDRMHSTLRSNAQVPETLDCFN
jgi:hypothetical protein